jgi:hypothetical protein
MAIAHNPKPAPLVAVQPTAAAFGSSDQRGRSDVAANAAASVVGQVELPGGGNIDKIRDIIFGNQMRDYEKRFVRLEERLMKESADLRAEVKSRLEQLENHGRTELQMLTDRLKNEQEERLAADQDLTRGLHELGKTGEKKIAQLDEQTVKSARDLRQQLLDQAKQLSDDIRHKFDDLAATIEREATELRGDKTDRTALAGLFTEMALRLSNDVHVAGERT